MTGIGISCSGIYTPEQIEELREELKRGDRPGETEAEREDRAAEILNRRNAERIRDSARTVARRNRPLPVASGLQSQPERQTHKTV